MDERQMRRALGLDPIKEAKPAYPIPKIRVILSVRNQWGGKPLRYEHTESTVSSLQAEVEACKAARAAGYVVWCTLEMERV